MPGPPPKNPATRRRRNLASTHATLPPPGSRANARVPPLPKKGSAAKSWHTLTCAWWVDVWRSPMAAKFLAADRHGLYMLAALVDRFWASPTPQLAGEVRLQGQRYGLSPIDRWRLQWELRDPGDTKPKGKPPAPRATGRDPRALLRVVK